MRPMHLGLTILFGGGTLVSSQLLTSCGTILTCSTVLTISVQPTVTVTSSVSSTAVVPALVQPTTTASTPDYVTITSIYRGFGSISPAPSIATISPPVGTKPGTIQYVYNPSTAIVTVLGAGDTTRTSIIASQTGGTPGTVEILLPSYVTTTVTSGYASERITVSPTGTVQGTVSVVIPSTTVVYCNLNGARTAAPNPTATGATSNKGVQYGLYTRPYFNSPPFNENTGFANYNVTDFDAANRTALHVGKTNTIGYSVGTTTLTQPVYADTTQSFPTQNITLIHRGFLYARTAGIYTFTSTNPDDIILLWVGQNAVSGFTRANANIVKSYPATTTTYTVAAVVGQYIPFRVQWANGGVPGFLGFQITNPANQVLINNAGSTDIVTGACDGSTPVFPQWYGP